MCFHLNYFISLARCPQCVCCGVLLADDARSNKVLMVMEYLEGGPVVLGEGQDGRARMSEAIARKFFRDTAQVSV